jgi:hypothetical protein
LVWRSTAGIGQFDSLKKHRASRSSEPLSVNLVECSLLFLGSGGDKCDYSIRASAPNLWPSID